jgi:ABC-type amino acid transport substrate-binding protein
MLRWLLLGCALIVTLPGPCAAQTVIRLARIAEVPDQFVGGEILRVVYARLGIAVEMVDVTGARGLALSSAGLLDGEVHRIAGVERDHLSLMRIAPAINHIEPTAFTASLQFAVQGWESLRPYVVGIVRGVGSSEAGVAGLPQVERVADLETLIRMMHAGRLDLFVFDRFSGEVMLRRLRLQDEIRPLVPPLQRIEIFHYLHERHRHLVPRLQRVLAQMQADGELARLRAALIGRMLEDALTPD